MASIGILPAPFFTACPSLRWRAGTAGGTCLALLQIYIQGGGSAELAVNFNLRGKISPTGCGGADAYISFIGINLALIDVWKAYKDGIWTSSVDIKVYAGNLAPTSVLYRADIYNAGAGTVDKAASTDLAACGTTLQATVTVTSTGVLTIA